MKRQSGITLVELLVSVTILALATTVALVVYDQARLAYKAGENTTEQQQVARIAFDVITSDIRMAGFNTNPDGNPARPDEQIEAAYPTAITVRADFDADDPVDVDLPEQSLGGTGAAFHAVSTGNDEIVSYVLAKPDGTSPDTLEFSADVGDSVRDASIEDIAIGLVDLAQTDPPYTLYRVVLENDPTGCCGTSFARRIPIVDNVRSLRFTYWDRAGNEITAPGGEETAAALAARTAIRRVGVEIEALTRDSDPHWRDQDDPDPDTQLFRKFELRGEVVPPNLGRAAIPDLQADTNPPGKPSTPLLYPGHCEGLYVSWTANAPQDDVAYYRVVYGTDAAQLHGVSSTVTPGLYIDDLQDGTDYFVGVEAIDAAGNRSSMSTVVDEGTTNTNVPQASLDLTATDTEIGTIDLGWTATDENTSDTLGDPDTPMIRDLEGYRVYRSSHAGVTVSSANRIADETTVANLPAPLFTDDMVPVCKPHWYKVAPVDGCGVEGQASSAVSGVAAVAAPPKDPIDVQVAPTGASQVTVGWSPVTQDTLHNPMHVEQYNVYISPEMDQTATAPASWSLEGSVTGATEYVDSIVIPSGKTRFYMVEAATDCGAPNDKSMLSAPARPDCNFSGRVVITAPAPNATVSGFQNVQVSVVGAIEAAVQDKLQIDFVHGVSGATETISQDVSGYLWNYAWDPTPTGSPPFAPGPYTVTAQVRQWVHGEVCWSSASVSVDVQ